jgi:hypothetical protein
MGINSYNNETEQSKLIEDLKTLPKIKAPENFELNLMTRIQNQNFGEVKEERANFNFIKFLAPSAVVVSAVIIFFLFFSNSNHQIDNPLMTEPPAIISDSQGSIISSQTDIALNEINKKETPEISKQTERIAPDAGINKQVKRNEVASENISKYPISRNRSVALDDFISGDAQKRNNIQQGNVVNNGEETADFDGFFVRQQPDKETIAKYRAMIDSVKKAQLKADSIKNARK